MTTSVLLDAGAGDVWKYTEKSTGFEAGRSEGLGVASFHMFGSGAFSSDPGSAPHRADSAGLKGLADDSVRTAFQVDDDANPLVGCEGRTQVQYNSGLSCLVCSRDCVGVPRRSRSYIWQMESKRCYRFLIPDTMETISAAAHIIGKVSPRGVGPLCIVGVAFRAARQQRRNMYRSECSYPAVQDYAYPKATTSRVKFAMIISTSKFFRTAVLVESEGREGRGREGFLLAVSSSIIVYRRLSSSLRGAGNAYDTVRHF